MSLACHTKNCPGKRRRFQVVCDDCFRRLPRAIILGLRAAKDERRRADFARLCREAGAFVAGKPCAAPSVTPRTAYANTARLLGEEL
ncbi:MAG: hypothetical protein A4S12_06910 [Proteobacteria bacterium SG_bin5]|nr:hypothetical protein [Sphingomonas sp.]OQW42063.1 MAG: hypothetical protein A4S12_06910 [Proteobacteria bacterium SG_bin5]